MQHSLFNAVGVQLYSLREELQTSPEHCLAWLAEQGVTLVQTADLAQAKRLAPLLDKHKLTSFSSHLAWPTNVPTAQLADFQQDSVEQAVELGVKSLVIGYVPVAHRQQPRAYSTLADQLNRLGEQCKAAEIELLYHNHAFEFAPSWQGRQPYAELVQATLPELVGFELDIMWAHIAHQDVAELMQRLGVRLRQLHLKTYMATSDQAIYDEAQVAKGSFDCPLGAGEVDIERCLAMLGETPVAASFIEVDHCEDIFMNLAQSTAYLQGLAPAYFYAN